MKTIYPIPDKIRDYYVIQNDAKNSEYAAWGSILCSCGGNKFKLLYLGKKAGSFSSKIVAAKTEIGNRMIIVAKCLECEKEINLYDSMTDGAKNDGYAPSFLEGLSAFDCKKCSDSAFSIEIAYTSNGNDGRSDWNNQFETIRISAECACGKMYKGLID